LREPTLRTATVADLDAIRELIAASVRGLQHEYSEGQREQALASVFTPDTQLIADGSYFILEAEGSVAKASDGTLAACGGWSWRKTLFGGDHHHASRNAERLDPAKDAAKIRAFFVHPQWARRGLGTRLLAACERAAWDAGFRRCEMGATLSGVPLYERQGYRRVADILVDLPGGERLPVVRMEKRLTSAPAMR
jgi:GNAT superfamily N-acetyltransferase